MPGIPPNAGELLKGAFKNLFSSKKRSQQHDTPSSGTSTGAAPGVGSVAAAATVGGVVGPGVDFAQAPTTTQDPTSAPPAALPGNVPEPTHHKQDTYPQDASNYSNDAPNFDPPETASPPTILQPDVKNQAPKIEPPATQSSNNLEQPPFPQTESIPTPDNQPVAK